MDRDQPGSRGSADDLMRQHRFGDAIIALSDEVQRHPQDPQPLLKLGICHLLNRSETEFLAIHRRAAPLVEQLRPAPPEVSRLWTLSRSLMAKMTGAALVMSTAAGLGCDRTEAPPAEVAPEPTALSTAEPEPADTAAEANTGTASQTAKASGVGADAGTAAGSQTSALRPTTPPAATTATLTPTSIQTKPAHRYSGGVRPRPPTPAHRYSGGVLRN